MVICRQGWTCDAKSGMERLYHAPPGNAYRESSMSVHERLVSERFCHVIYSSLEKPSLKVAQDNLMKVSQSTRKYTPEEKAQLIQNLDIEGTHSASLWACSRSPPSRSPCTPTRRMARRRARQLSPPPGSAHIAHPQARSKRHYGRVC